ncbi:MAG: sigma-70 family RNA polymerase sigma factor [Acidobacteriales bacterium]|nr:sigma-70 family RNA polymerase sigma factor [Terriglobales bacterium]
MRAPAESTNGTDERLLIEAAQRDRSRFASLYEHNFDRVYAYIAHRVRDRDLAEDLTAEVFHQALATLSRFEWQGVPFVAWLLGIAAHVIAARWKAAKLRPQETAGLLADLSELSGTGTAGNGNGNGHAAMQVSPRDLQEVEQRATIAKLVATLPDDQRLVITRRFLEHRSIREIAQEMGRTEGAVKQLQFRALENLRTRIRSHRNV